MAKLFQKLTRPGVALLKAMGRSYRYEFMNGHIDAAVYQRGEIPIYCSWHQRWYAGITLMPRRGPISIMVSQSQDGDFISEMIMGLGWRVARGSSSRGGMKALRELLGYIRQGVAVGHIVDGPRGPFGQVKPGLLTLAQLSGMPIVPMVISPQSKWTFRSWDRFMIPKPFSRILIRFDEPVHVPRKLDEAGFEALRHAIEDRLRQLYEETDQMWLTAETRQG
ncbi:MAG: lysophospholipid acyltransferase family protein [Syntrophobacteraceae bacterium]|jgi:hypothetical protein|nr:lysophospholipid acyltransferase family protein [Syntrophobacteraceae bacterium]